MEKQRKTRFKLENEKIEQKIIHLNKQLHTIKNNKVENSTIQTKFDKFGNIFSMLETSNKVDEEKITKENNISLSRYPNDSLPSVIVEYSDKKNTWLTIESEDPSPITPLGIWKTMLCFY